MRLPFLVLCAVLPALSVLPGCSSLPGGKVSSDAALAAIKVEFGSRYNIDQAIPTVFRSEGYQFVERRGDTYRFYRGGDATTRETYGDWFAPGTQVRVDVAVTSPEFGEHRLTCDAFKLPPGSGRWLPVHESSGQFRRILKKVKKLVDVM